MATINISAVDGWLRRFDPRSPRIKITCADRSFETNILSLTSAKKDEEIRWYLEDFATHDSLMISRAKGTIDDLLAYGTRLAEGINLENFLLPANTQLKIQIRDDGRSGRSINRIIWEILENVDIWPASTRPELVTVVRIIDQTPPPGPHALPAISFLTSINILVVPARPQDEDDVPHRLVSSIISGVIQELENQDHPDCTMEIVRPASYEAFLRHLSLKRFDIVHLDMHGILGEDKTMLAFFDSTLGPHYVSGDQIAKDLSELGVHRVIMNACNSANPSSECTNLAAIMVRGGVSEVVAMSYKANASAVEAFTRAMYTNILVSRLPFSQAAKMARATLATNHTRQTTLGLSIDVYDYFVPVIYSARSYHALEENSSDRRARCAAALPSTEPDMLFGRENDILRIENALLLRKNIALLTGDAGVGKTALVKHLQDWWKRTFLVSQSASICLPSIDPWNADEFYSSIAVQLLGGTDHRPSEAILSPDSKDRYLIVVDNVEGATRAQKAGFGKALVGLSLSKHLVIICSRNTGSWLSNLSFTHQLRPLAKVAAMQNLANLLKYSTPPVDVVGREETEYVERLVHLVEGNPLALKLLAQHMSIGHFTPKACFEGLLNGDVVLCDRSWLSNTEGARSVRQLEEICQLTYTEEDGVEHPIDSAAHPNPDVLLLTPTIFGLFWKCLPVDELPLFEKFITHQLYISRVPNDGNGNDGLLYLELEMKACSLYSNHAAFGSSEDLETYQYAKSLKSILSKENFLRDLVPQNLDIPVRRYMRVHPVLTLTLRFRHNYPASEIECHKAAFYLLHTHLAKSHSHLKHYWDADSVPWRVELDLNFFNFLAASRFALAVDQKTKMDFQILRTLVLPTIEESMSANAHHFALFYDLSKTMTEVMLGKLDDFSEPSDSFQRELRYLHDTLDLDKLDGPMDDESELYNLRWEPRVLAIYVLMSMYIFADYFNLKSSDDYESLLKELTNEDQWPRFNGPMGECMTMLADACGNICRYVAAIFPNYRAREVRPAGDDQRALQLRNSWAQKMRDLGDDDFPDITTLDDIPLRTLGEAMFVKDYQILRETIQKMIGRYQFAAARAMVQDILAREINDRGNLPMNKCVVLECLSLVSAAQGLYLDAIENLTRAYSFEDSMGNELSIERLGKRDIVLAGLYEKTRQPELVENLFGQVIERINHARNDANAEANVMLEIAKLAFTRGYYGPVCNIFLLIRGAKAAYCHVPNNVIKEGHFLKAILETATRTSLLLEWNARRYQDPVTTAIFNIVSLFRLRVWLHIIRARAASVFAARRSDDPSIPPDPIVSEAERHLFASPEDDLTEEFLPRATFAKERALFHHIYLCAQNHVEPIPPEQYPASPFCPTDGASQTVPPDYTFPPYLILKLAGYYYNTTNPEANNIAREIPTPRSLLGMVEDYWYELRATMRRSIAQAFQASYVREFRRAGILDVAAELEAMTEEEFMEARRRMEADNQ